jgi:phosphoribosylformimino-5-aminoimidazole carboxamide ribotide isomerase
MQIIPAIDIIDGKCVRLTQGDYQQQTTYHDNPLEIAKQFEAAGLTRLHLVDLDGARQKAVKNWKVLQDIASHTSMEIDFGGGVNSAEDVRLIFGSGAKWVTVGSIAVKNENELEQWFADFGADKFMLGADVKDRQIAIHGWLETTSINIIDFIRKYTGKGVKQVFCTDVSKDGKLEGPSIDLYKEILESFPGLSFIASGGVASVDDLTALKKIGCSGAIVGKAIYENRISLEQIKAFV